MRDGARRALAALLMLLSVAAIPGSSLGDDAPLPDSRLGIRTVPLLLLSRPDVRADLGLNPAQTAEARRAISELHAKAAALRGKTGAEAIAARRAIDEEQRRRLEAMLSPQQQDRLIQIDLQWEGPSALISRKMVAESLNLDDRQRATLAQAVSDRDRRRDPGPGPRGRRTAARRAGAGDPHGGAAGPLEGDARASPGHPATGRPEGRRPEPDALRAPQASGEGPTVSRSNSGLPRSPSKSDSSAIRARRSGSRSSARASSSSALAALSARLQ